MSSLTDDELRDLARALATVLDARAPGWTGGPSGDPGVTLLQVMAFLAETVSSRQPSDETSVLATLVRERLRAWTTSCETGDTQRVRYFFGQLLSARDFQDEQSYHIGMRRHLVQCLLGAGVVRGLDVEVEGTGGQATVSVSPGCAVTAHGDLLVVDRCVRCTLRVPGSRVVVSLFHLEREVREVPAAASPATEASRIEERVGIECATDPSGDGVAIARLVLSDDGWHRDPTFAPVRSSHLSSVV